VFFLIIKHYTIQCFKKTQKQKGIIKIKFSTAIKPRLIDKHT
jgi:hypothetical protein